MGHFSDLFRTFCRHSLSLGCPTIARKHGMNVCGHMIHLIHSWTYKEPGRGLRTFAQNVPAAMFFHVPLRPKLIGNGPNTASESTVSNTELSEFFCPHPVPGRELSEFLSAYYLCDKANSPSFSQNSPSLPQNSVRLSEFSSPKQYSRNSILPVS